MPGELRQHQALLPSGLAAAPALGAAANPCQDVCPVGLAQGEQGEVKPILLLPSGPWGPVQSPQ